MALRVSLGEGRVRLVRHVLTEALLLSAMGAVIGVALAIVGAGTLVRIILSGREFLRLPQPIDIQVQPDVQVLLFTATIAVLTAVLFGAAPAWHAFTSAPASLLRAHGAGGETRSRRLFGKGLVVAQVALSVALLSAAGLFVHHLSNLRNQAMARYYFGDRNPIGGRIQLVGPSNSGITGAPPDQLYEIVGVVGDAKYLDLRDVPPRTIYLNVFQEPRMLANRFALRTTGRPEAVTGEVRRIVREELKTVPIADVSTIDGLIDASIVPERVMATLSSVFGGLGALLAALGLYGLLAYTVTRRTNEIGIRIALGASRADISRMVLRGALGLVGAGLVIGVPLGLLSRRAARVEPAEALRQ
jgi:hypothetical protein